MLTPSRGLTATLLVAALTFVGRASSQPPPNATDIQHLRSGAEHGDAIAQFQLGYWYETGAPQLKPNYREAAAWYRRAAAAGYAPAQLNLGALYRLGRGVKKNEAEAARWYRKAADQGNRGAQANLARMYQAGTGVPRDERESFELFRKAAEQNHARAQYETALSYEQGTVVNQDYAGAFN
jgi:uncharacterized protein